MEKKDIHNISQAFETRLNNLQKDKSFSEEDIKRINQFIEDCTIGKNSSRKVEKGRLLRYLTNLKILAKYFKKPFLKLTEKDLTQFYLDMERDKIKRENKKPYSASSKNEFIKTLKKFGKWLYKEDKIKYEKIFDWLKKFKEHTEIPALSREEVEKIAASCDTRDKAIIMFLFDSGTRAEEFLNIRIEDLKRDQGEKFYKVRIKVSKTKPRTIILPLCSQALDGWLNIHPQKDNPQAFLFPITYDGLRMMLNRKGKIINKHVYPHLFRHSSVTYYANRYKNPYKLCYRYGWAMNSEEVQRYIDREGIEEEEIKEIVEREELDNLKRKHKKLEEDFALSEDNNNRVFKQITERFKVMELKIKDRKY